MKLYFDEITETGKHIDYTGSFEADDIKILVENFSGTIYKTSPDFFLDGELSVSFSGECHRCLEKVDGKDSARIQVIIRRESDMIDEEEVELSEDDLGIYIMDTEELDLNEIIEQEALLLVPMKLLCSEECDGLCTECGKNLNKGECTCDGPEDPRWGALKNLKK